MLQKKASSGVVKTRPTRSNPSGKIIEKPQTPAGPKPESSRGYQISKSLSEKIIDSWFDQHYAHSFSGFLKSLNETEAGVVREILLGKDNLASSGQFSDVTTQEESFVETSNVSIPIQTDGTKEKKSVTQILTTCKESTEIETKTDTESPIVTSPVSKVKETEEVLKTPESRKGSSCHNTPEECKQRQVNVKLCDINTCPLSQSSKGG